MKKVCVLSVCALILGLCVAKPAKAQSPHFVSVGASVNSSGALVLSFKEAGLGQGTVSYLLGAYGTGYYGCINRGGNHPKATNKTAVSGIVAASVTLPVRRNGNLNGSLTVGPPPAPSNFSCPGGMKAALISITYESLSNVPSLAEADIESVLENAGDADHHDHAGVIYDAVMGADSGNLFFEDMTNWVDGSSYLDSTYTYCNANYAQFC